MLDRSDLDRFVLRVCDASNAVFPKRNEYDTGCPFHLAPCYCGAPMWQQPCMICGYYPMYSATNSSLPKSGCTRERYIAIAERHGGIAAWYFASFRRVVAYQPHSTFKAKIDALVEDAKSWEGVPSAAEIWDAFHPVDSQ